MFSVLKNLLDLARICFFYRPLSAAKELGIT